MKTERNGPSENLNLLLLYGAEGRNCQCFAPSPVPYCALQLPTLQQTDPTGITTVTLLESAAEGGRSGEEQVTLTYRAHFFPQDCARIQQGKGIRQQIVVPGSCRPGDWQVVFQRWASLRSLEQKDLNKGHGEGK